MYTFKKFVEGVAVSDDSGRARLLTQEEEQRFLSEYPEFGENKVVAYYLDFLPPSLKGLRVVS